MRIGWSQKCITAFADDTVVYRENIEKIGGNDCVEVEVCSGVRRKRSQ